MTTLTTKTGHTTAMPVPATPADAGYLTTTAQTARRTLLQYVRTPQLLVMPPITAGLFLLIFRYIFGGAISTGASVGYVDFLVPGFLAQTVLWNGMNIPAGVAEDAMSGVYDRLRSLPIPRSAVMAGRAFADTILNGWGLAVTAVLGFAIGFRTHADAAAVLAGFALLLVIVYAFDWLFITLGLISGNVQAAQAVASLIVVPVAFVSAAFVPIRSMPGWMQAFAQNQPVTVMINAVRSLMLGGPHAVGIGHTTGYWVLLTLAWCAGILGVFAAAAVALFGRTR